MKTATTNSNQATPEAARSDQSVFPLPMLLKDRAYATLKQLILSETFPAGSFLSERQLVSDLGGMSKTPIRAALERLQVDGLVTVSPQQGILVRDITLHEVTDIFDIRIALETFVAGRLAGHITPQQRTMLEANLTQSEACVQAGDEVTYAHLDAAFHLLLCEFFDNGEIIQVMQRNRDKLLRVMLRVLRRDKGRMTTSQADHRGIVEALLLGDSVLAIERVRNHLNYGKGILLT